ncbi:MAG: hypothetical protein BMS9Abin37_1628 [Acidobacteriota bacterium]|nr:MAG: hypothetical protein BMS9Abin37_1628 [Acidobacteriota bacterium]
MDAQTLSPSGGEADEQRSSAEGEQRRCSIALIVLAALAAEPLCAQPKPVTFYYQNVPLWSQETELVEGNLSDFNRPRVMSEPAWGDFYFRFAYEQVAIVRQNETRGIFVGLVPSGGEWLDLQWTIAEEEHFLWQHRFDRLEIGWSPSSSFELTVGRQAVSWATTLFLTPADPFLPFNPADPFRDFRAGVDAVRARIYPGPLSEIDVLVRPTKNNRVGEELTMLGRGLTTWNNWELSGWGGSLYGDISGAFGAAGSVGSLAVRGEGVMREIDGDVIFRGTIGLDHLFSAYDRDLYVVVEYQRDGLAAPSAEDYPALLGSDPFLRGEFQVLGRDESAVQASYQLHPLWSLAALGLWNIDDGSVLISPSFSYSASNEATITGGVFFGFGDDGVTPQTPLPSEYGALGLTVYVSASLFF